MFYSEFDNMNLYIFSLEFGFDFYNIWNLFFSPHPDTYSLSSDDLLIFYFPYLYERKKMKKTLWITHNRLFYSRHVIFVDFTYIFFKNIL